MSCLAGQWASFAAPNLADHALAPSSGPRGATMFADVPASVSGVVASNDFADPAMWGARYREFEVGATGTGIAVGDYDGDGRPDIFVVSKTESCHLFRNLGGFRFEDVTVRAGVGDKGGAAKIWKQGAAFADVNNDGRLDLYVCRFNAPNLLYINRGDGTFQEMAHAYGLDVTDACVMAAFADYDRDGKLDVFIQTNLLDANAHPAGQRNYLFHNNGDGTFTNVTERAGITGEGQGHSAIWWDFDNDGWPDVYVANDFEVADKLYRNNRDGTFTNMLDAVVPHTPFSSMGADLGDINNDGLIDLFVADMAATTHTQDQRGMAESRNRTLDDQLNPNRAPQYERNVLFVNSGADRCLELGKIAGLGATDWTWAPRFEDLDNDGRLDLFVTNGMYREPTNMDLLARQLNADSMAERVRIMRDSPILAERHIARRNLGDFRFEDVGASWGLDQRAVSFGAAFGDFDGDGDLDLIYANYQKGPALLRNDCDSGHRVVIELRGTISNRFGVGAKVTVESALGLQVRQLVLSRGYMSTSEPVLHFGLGNDTAIRTLKVSWPSGVEQTFTDLAVDRRYTIEEVKVEPDLRAGLGRSDQTSQPGGQAPPQFTECAAAVGLSIASREDLVDDTALQPLIPVRLSRRGPALAVGVLRAGGPEAVVVGGTTVTPLQVLARSSATGAFAPIADALPTRTMPVDDGPTLLFDADRDGRADLLVTKGGAALPAGAAAYQPTLWLGDGEGHFRRASDGALPALPICAGAAVVSDFDRDGALDVFIGGRIAPGKYPAPAQSALLRNRGGQFVDVTDQIAPELRRVGLVTAAIWTDVDGDGWLDLLVALEWGPVRFFHNVRGERFEDLSDVAGFAAAGSGWWTSIAAGDFNGDGRMDYVVGNAGLNTPYRADSAHPAVLFLGDFGTEDDAQIVEAAYEGDRLVPVRSRRALGAAIPSVLRRFPKTNAYATASLADIVGADKLAKAQRFAASELRSGVFLSQPDGRYRFEPLPRLAQAAPLDGLAVGDFDGDGNLDVYALQNSYAPIPSVGRYDGGLSVLVRGDGHGHFTAVMPQESGLVVSGDAKALGVLDFNGDGWADFVATRSNGTSLAFQNGGVRGRHGLRIDLAGPAGNPTGIGARVTVEYADGGKTMAEVAGGCGYHSQWNSSCWFGYAAANAVKRVVVRRADGATTAEEVSTGATRMLLKR